MWVYGCVFWEFVVWSLGFIGFSLGAVFECAFMCRVIYDCFVGRSRKLVGLVAGVFGIYW